MDLYPLNHASPSYTKIRVMSSKNLISIIMPVHNGERYIDHAINSCLQQSFQDGWELIIVNDGSTDKTEIITKKHLADSRIKLIEQDKQGVSAARNNAIRNSSGNYIAFLDADDCFLPNTIRQYHTACEITEGTINLFYCDYLCINEKGETTNAMRVKPPMKRPGLHLQFLLPRLLPLLPSTTFIKKEVFDHTGLFNEAYIACEDIELFARIAEQHDIAKLDIVNCRRRMHQAQTIRNKPALVYWRDKYNIAYLERHDFCYFCTTHDRIKQAKLAENFGDTMLNAPQGPLIKSARYLYQLSLSMKPSINVQTKLDRIQDHAMSDERS
ncbi:MAG: hypothetical protein C1942_01125 [Prosthecochloris sp.]|nr:hypothetical protein [Prosthecochloris sp.]